LRVQDVRKNLKQAVLHEGREERAALLHLEVLRERAQFLEETDEVSPLGTGSGRLAQAREQLAEESGVRLERENHLDVVEQHDGRQRTERGVVQRARENHVLEVPDAVRLMNLRADGRILDRHHLFEHHGVAQERPVLRGRR
jgi:hypothetical protein